MKLNYIVYCFFFLLMFSCGSSKDYSKPETSLEEELIEKNRNNISLAQRIRQLPGVAFRNGVPVIVKYSSDIYGGQGDNFEPLYLLNDYIVGNSFRSINQLVTTADIKKVEIVGDAEAAFYGARAGNGVIKVTTFQ